MTPNSENAMARFLLAILNQKNLKDIDWNKVASDPVLMQPITNGHAARMRFSRFRNSVLGHESQKRKTIADKCRITKPKKAQQTKLDGCARPGSGVSLSSSTQMCQDSPKVKHEPAQPPYLGQFSPSSNHSPYIVGRDDYNTRFLTPCSDDMGKSQVNAPSLEDLRQRNGFGPSIDFIPDFMRPTSQDATMTQSPTQFHTFDAAYDLSSYRIGANDAQSPDVLELNTHQSLVDCGQEWADHLPGDHF